MDDVNKVVKVEESQGSIQVGVEYLSVGANRQTAAGDWHADGTVAFGADLNVVLWKPNAPVPRGVQRLLSGHKDVVKAVRFLPSHNGTTAAYLLSGGDDHAVKLWKLDTRTGDALCVQTAVEHTAPVNCIATLKTTDLESANDKGEGQGADVRTSTIFATGAADATVRIWQFDGTAIRVLQTIKTNAPKYFPLAVALSPLGVDGGHGTETTSFILAAAGTRPVVQIYTGSVSSAAETTTTPIDFGLRATLTGHEGWIRSLDFTLEKVNDPSSDLLLASASQDKYIRLWRVHKGSELPAQAATASDPTVGAYLPGRSPSNKAHRFKAGGSSGESGHDYSVTFESLLFNHDDWIYSAKWHLNPASSSSSTTASTTPNLQLLSTSADNSLAIWEADPSSGIWYTTARLGEISREKGATTATGSIGGFWTGLWSPQGNSILTLGRTGSWRKWDWDAEQRAWTQGIAVSGHVRAVTGIAWARPSGAYLLSTSADQTTRLHAQWKKTMAEGGENGKDHGQGTWHEMARPQIHGYDLNCIDTLSETRFVSGADEKLMRVFSQPRAVARMLRGVAGIQQYGLGGGNHDAHDALVPDAANMPVLGLSNKATVDDVDTITTAAAAATADATTAQQQQQPPPLATSTDATREAVIDPATITRPSTLSTLTHPPFEESLSRHTLWPEEEKLYGHGYELSCLAASHDGSLVASACKASSLNHAVIRIFETQRWTELRPPLAVHTLTATRLRFSPDDGFLLSVGRDRQWAVFERQKKQTQSEQTGSGFELFQAEPKGHTRMILDAAWAPVVPAAATAAAAADGRISGGQRVFATAGRDKNVKIWAMDKPADNDHQQQEEEHKPKFVLAATIPCEQPVTAVDFLPRFTSDGQLVLASGTEAGVIRIHVLKLRSHDNGGGVDVSSTVTLEPKLCLPKAVLQLSWRPSISNSNSTEASADENDLAIAGEDNSLRIYKIKYL
ncbi:WD40-repeat-containing domain protein [Coniella lustricola]|uniref:Elongator complex protein 2 n=1 Tax=Coniella lustricola TaxID=2025994 RepID=A0A2T3A5U2_9PEZI|nr:WD40-repeat-containing domain protein [Coniella lustricola]